MTDNDQQRDAAEERANAALLRDPDETGPTIRATVTEGGALGPMLAGMGEGARSWRLTLTTGTGAGMRLLGLDYYTGSGIKENPTAAEILGRYFLDCLDLDGAEFTEEGFRDWCENFGSDPDSREAEATYRKVIRNAVDLAAFFAPDLGIILNAITDPNTAEDADDPIEYDPDETATRLAGRILAQ